MAVRALGVEREVYLLRLLRRVLAVGFGRNLLRAPQFLKADPHRAVVETGLSRNTPAQINGLELKLPARAKLLQFREGVPFMLEVRERRADEDANDRLVANLGLVIQHSQCPQA